MAALRCIQLALLAILSGLLIAFPLVATIYHMPPYTRYGLFSSDGRFFALSTNDGTGVFETATGDFQRFPWGNVAISTDGRVIVTDWKSTTVWDWRTARKLHTWQCRYGTLTMPIAISPDSSLAAVGEEAALHILNLRTFAEVLSLPLESSVSCAAFSPDGRTLAMVVGDVVHEIWLWNLQNETIQLLMKAGDDEAIHWIAFSPDGSRLAAGADTVHLWDVKHLTELWQVDIGDSGDAVFSTDGRWLAVASGGRVSLVDTDGDHEIRTIRFDDLIAIGSASGEILVVAGSSLNRIDPVDFRFASTRSGIAVRGAGPLVCVAAGFLAWLVAWSLVTLNMHRRTLPQQRLSERIIGLIVAVTGVLSITYWAVAIYLINMTSVRPVERELFSTVVAFICWALPSIILLLVGFRHLRGAFGICATLYCVIALLSQWISLVMVFSRSFSPPGRFK
jgi:hypothetical protein